MATSILDDVKKVLGIDPDYHAFDADITMHINTAFGELFQLGIGPETGFEILSNAENWDMFLPENDPTFNGVKSYVVLFVRLLFDPPPTSFGIQAMQSQLDKLVWRLNARREEVKYPWNEPIILGPTLPLIQEL